MVLARTIHVFIKLIPVILALRKDRVLWISQEGKNIDEKRFRRNAQRVLNTCISLGPAPEDKIDKITGELKLL